ncbi:hypothetical protein T310_3717, partial [Rasamsonia emersonii CBS 393.64]
NVPAWAAGSVRAREDLVRLPPLRGEGVPVGVCQAGDSGPQRCGEVALGIVQGVLGVFGQGTVDRGPPVDDGAEDVEEERLQHGSNMTVTYITSLDEQRESLKALYYHVESVFDDCLEIIRQTDAVM